MVNHQWFPGHISFVFHQRHIWLCSIRNKPNKMPKKLVLLFDWTLVLETSDWMASGFLILWQSILFTGWSYHCFKTFITLDLMASGLLVNDKGILFTGWSYHCFKTFIRKMQRKYDEGNVFFFFFSFFWSSFLA